MTLYELRRFFEFWDRSAKGGADIVFTIVAENISGSDEHARLMENRFREPFSCSHCRIAARRGNYLLRDLSPYKEACTGLVIADSEDIEDMAGSLAAAAVLRIQLGEPLFPASKSLNSASQS